VSESCDGGLRCEEFECCISSLDLRSVSFLLHPHVHVPTAGFRTPDDSPVQVWLRDFALSTPSSLSFWKKGESPDILKADVTILKLTFSDFNVYRFGIRHLLPSCVAFTAP